MAGSFLIFLAAAFLAEIVATVAGFGSSTILVPIATAFFDIKTAIALVGLFHLFWGNGGRNPLVEVY